MNACIDQIPITAELDAQLHAEARKIWRETGLTPQQLADQRDRLFTTAATATSNFDELAAAQARMILEKLPAAERTS